MRESTRLVMALPVGVLEIPLFYLAPCESPACVIASTLVVPSGSAFALTRVPPVVFHDRPLDIEFIGTYIYDEPTAVLVSRFVSLHTRLLIVVDTYGQASAPHSVPVSIHLSDSGWVIRALIRPALWADADSVTVAALSVGGRPLPSDFLPETLRIGYNHAPAPPGVVHSAAQAGNARALQAALNAGRSTEETDQEVSRERVAELRNDAQEQPSPTTDFSTTVWPHSIVLCRF